MRPVPGHFLHVAVGGVAWSLDDVRAELERGREALASLAAFDATYRHLNCFHSAVVAEVGEGRDAFVNATRRIRPELDTRFALPHVTIAIATGAISPDPLRRVLVPLHDEELGSQRVDEITLCAVPAGRSTLLMPWTVVGRATLA
jgi:2'-5' RNA ligase